MAEAEGEQRKKSILMDRKKSITPEDRKKSVVSMQNLKPEDTRSKSMARMSKIGLGHSFSRTRVRRQSYGFGSIPGIKPIERTSQVAIEFKRPPLIYLNTYQLDPYRKFHIESVTKVCSELLDEMWTGHKYNAQSSPLTAIKIAGELMRKVKAMDFNRYRVITVVTIGQKRAQSYNNAITFLWDHERDGYVDMERENTTCFIQVTLFGIYFD